MIGGFGFDCLIGNANEDILIGGTTNYDENTAALRQILNVWEGNGIYQQRIAAITNASFTYKLVADVTVHDDATVDYLTGSAGQDWFFANTDCGVLDIIADLASNECSVDVD